jgi:hypothetical protein
MKRSLNFGEKNSSKSIQLNSETSFIKFLRLIVENNDEVDCDGDIITAKLKCFSKDTDNEITLEFKKESSYYKLASTIPDLKDTHTVLLSFDFSDIKGCELKLVYDDVDYKLPIEATKEFNDHINNELNKKIFFSAPFGKGKSTFLEYFFEDKKEDYEVFKVFPINYSIASNKDIFKYIKVDVLLQLISKGVTFEKEVFSNLLLAQQFAINNSKSIIKSLLEIGLSLNKETAPLTKVFDGVNTLFEKFDDFQKKSQIDDFKKAKDYIGQLYDDEASLFEDNYYTQLVRQLIEQLKIENNKKTVLVIDDLDRMDPEHIFRILNVISAHYDSYMLEDNKEYCNKFGFDKIILVADINNIKSIYEHRFGENVDFDGYINKFYSNNIFKFDSKKVGQILLGELNNKYRNNSYVSSLRILNIFNSLELLSLRQIIKLSNDFSFSDIPFTRDRIFDELRFFRLGLYTPILDALTDVFHSKENFIKIIDFNVRNSRIKTDESIDFICKHLLASITSTFDDKIGHYKLNNKELEFNHKDDFATEGFKAEEIKQITDDGQKEDFTGFTRDNLSDLLIENIKHL